jgi:hypothetical protein
MKKTLALTAILLSLSGCATTANYEKMLSSWVGASELDLVRRWGPPTQSYETGGRKFLIYSSSQDVFLPGTAPTYTTTVIGNTAYTNMVGGTPGQTLSFSCRTTFEIHDERIVSWRWQGNDCRSLS